MKITQCVTINVHDPLIKEIGRIEHNGNMMIRLGNNEYHGTVTIFASDEYWDTLVGQVRAFRVAEELDRLQATVEENS